MKKPMSYRKEVTLVTLVAVTLAVIAIVVYVLFFGSLRKYEYKSDLKETSTEPAIYATYEDLLEGVGESYPFFQADMELYGGPSYVVPGLEMSVTLNDKTGKKAKCTSMTPQGLAVSDKYVFISSYCGTHKHKSVIYVINKETAKLEKTLVLDSMSHVGGLAYDTENQRLWVAEFINKKAYVGALELSEIEGYDQNSGKALKYSREVQLKGIKRASSVTYQDGRLLVVYFNMWKNGLLNVYKIGEDGNVNSKPSYKIDIDNTVQGVAYENNLLVMTKSIGPLNSTLQVFDLSANVDKNNKLKFNKDMTFNAKDAIYNIAMPEKLEQIYFSDGKLYMLFESGAFAYRFLSFSNVDRVISLDISKIK